jgi:hypothetical protein
MTDIVYNHRLELKEFEVSIPVIDKWFRENLPSSYRGLSFGSAIALHFNEMPSSEYTTAIDAYWAALTDDGSAAAEAAKQRSLLIEETKIQYGIKVRAYLGYLCELNTFTPTQYGQMLSDSDLAFCSQLLISGALESCKGIIDAYTPTEYFTESMKSGMSAELQKYITAVGLL